MNSTCVVSKTRRFMTLIEILIVVAILAMVTGVIGFNLTKAVEQERFHGSVNRLLDRLQFLQELMLIRNADGEVSFEKKNGTLYFRSSAEGSISSILTRILNNSQGLPAVEKVTLMNKEGKEISADPTLTFIGLGNVSTEGVLKITRVGDREQRYIALPPWHTPLEISTSFPQWEEKKEPTSRELFPYELLTQE